MRNREAARYARWAAIAAGLAALAVAGVYVNRSVGRARALRLGPAAVPATVAQQSDQFSFSKVDQNRTLFTVRASHLTRYKDQNRALLEDVWITIYGHDGSRNDNIHTHECSYELDSGVVHCEGAVEIDVDAARPAAGPATADTWPALQVKTSDLAFNRDTGEASSSAPVEFTFPGGQGRGIGVSYSRKNSIVRVQRAVEFDLAASPKTGNLPVSATGSSLVINRDQRQVVLDGPTTVREGSRELTADKIAVDLDENDRARDIVAEGHPQLNADQGGGKISVTAAQFEGFLNSSGQVERVVADGGVIGTRQAPAGADRFSARHVEIAMLPGQNLIQDMTAAGDVIAESHEGTDSRVLKTAALHMKFGASAAAKGSHTETIDQQRIESAETLAPATIESRSGDTTTTLAAKRFVAQMADGRRLEKLFGHSGVEVHSQTRAAAPQTISAAEMAVTFDAKGDWEVLDETGDVHFQQADRSASADHARIVQSTSTITLEGSPVISDAVSRTTASDATVNQESGDLRLSGGVASTYLPASNPAKQSDAVGFGVGAAHISADTLVGSTLSGHMVYAGHARLWQGESVLDADRIELWRDDKKLQATGHVVAVFPQASGPFSTPFGEAAEARKPAAPSHAPASAGSSGPTLWRVVAPALTYWADQGTAHLEGGVIASSNQGSLQSRTLDVFLGPAAPGASVPPAPVGASSAAGGRQLDRVLAQGGVIVRQGDRRGMAEQGEYTAADGKFVLSGGKPTVSDSSSNTATGRSLTFFVANDTILIDSQEGSRTLTKHRVEK